MNQPTYLVSYAHRPSCAVMHCVALRCTALQLCNARVAARCRPEQSGLQEVLTTVKMCYESPYIPHFVRPGPFSCLAYKSLPISARRPWSSSPGLVVVLNMTTRFFQLRASNLAASS
eukprot:362556-Chlamydomonas_euryale.AAC.4